jgi:hypothetical protein
MLNYKFKIPGLVLILAGIGMTAVYSLNRVDWQIPVFAISSSYLETRYFAVIRTNVFEEIIFLVYFSGFLLTAFSKEKAEREEYAKLRGEAWQSAILINSALLVFGTIFLYGKGFMMLIIYNVFSVFIFYLLVFYLKKWKLKTRINQ